MRHHRLTRVEPPYTDPYVRWCGRLGPQGPRLPDHLVAGRLLVEATVPVAVP